MLVKLFVLLKLVFMAFIAATAGYEIAKSAVYIYAYLSGAVFFDPSFYHPDTYYIVLSNKFGGLLFGLVTLAVLTVFVWLSGGRWLNILKSIINWISELRIVKKVRDVVLDPIEFDIDKLPPAKPKKK